MTRANETAPTKLVQVNEHPDYNPATSRMDDDYYNWFVVDVRILDENGDYDKSNQRTALKMLNEKFPNSAKLWKDFVIVEPPYQCPEFVERADNEESTRYVDWKSLSNSEEPYKYQNDSEDVEDKVWLCQVEGEESVPCPSCATYLTEHPNYQDKVDEFHTAYQMGLELMRQVLEDYPALDEDDVDEIIEQSAKEVDLCVDCYSRECEVCDRTKREFEEQVSLPEVCECYSCHFKKCLFCENDIMPTDYTSVFGGLVFCDEDCRASYLEKNPEEKLLQENTMEEYNNKCSGQPEMWATRTATLRHKRSGKLYDIGYSYENKLIHAYQTFKPGKEKRTKRNEIGTTYYKTYILNHMGDFEVVKKERRDSPNYIVLDEILTLRQ